MECILQLYTSISKVIKPALVLTPMYSAMSTRDTPQRPPMYSAMSTRDTPQRPPVVHQAKSTPGALPSFSKLTKHIPSPFDMNDTEKLLAFLTAAQVIKYYNVPSKHEDIAKQISTMISRGQLVCASPDGLSQANISADGLEQGKNSGAFFLHEICKGIIASESKRSEKGGFNEGVHYTTNNDEWSINCGGSKGLADQKVFIRTSLKPPQQQLDNEAELVFACVAAMNGVGPKIYAASVHEGLLTMVMEDSGQASIDVLNQIFKQKAWPTKEARVQVGESLATQINQLSRLGMCHTDLKIENVVVDTTGNGQQGVSHTKIIDYDPQFVYFYDSEMEYERNCIELLNLTMMLLGFLCSVWNPIYKFASLQASVWDMVRPLYERFHQLQGLGIESGLCDAVKRIKQVSNRRVIHERVAHQIVFKAEQNYREEKKTRPPKEIQHLCRFEDFAKDGYFVQIMEKIDHAWSPYLVARAVSPSS